MQHAEYQLHAWVGGCASSMSVLTDQWTASKPFILSMGQQTMSHMPRLHLLEGIGSSVQQDCWDLQNSGNV